MADHRETGEGTVSLPLSTSRETTHASIRRHPRGPTDAHSRKPPASKPHCTTSSTLTRNIAKLLATIAMIVICNAWMFGYMALRRGGFSIIGIRRHRTREHHRRG